MELCLEHPMPELQHEFRRYMCPECLEKIREEYESSNFDGTE